MTGVVTGTWPATGTPVDTAAIEAALDEFDAYWPAALESLTDDIPLDAPPDRQPVERDGSPPG